MAQEDSKVYLAEEEVIEKDLNSYEFERYDIEGYQIELKYAGEIGFGPPYGNLNVNDKQVEYSERFAFWGPVLYKDNYLYLTCYYVGKIKYTRVAEVNLKDLSVRLLGDQSGGISIRYIKDNIIYIDDYRFRDLNMGLRQIDITTGEELVMLPSFPKAMIPSAVNHPISTLKSILSTIKSLILLIAFLVIAFLICEYTIIFLYQILKRAFS